MKLFTLTMALLLSVSLHAETTTTKTTTTVVETTTTDDAKPAAKKSDDKVLKAAKNVSGETKKVLRKIGRAGQDGLCDLKTDKSECAKQKAEHKALNKKEDVEGVDGN